MRTIERTSQFKRDFKRESKGRYSASLSTDLVAVLTKLASNLPLEPRHRDHALTGNLAGCRDCHIKPDLVLIYRLPDEETLQLIRMGSHSELSL